MNNHRYNTGGETTREERKAAEAANSTFKDSLRFFPGQSKKTRTLAALGIDDDRAFRLQRVTLKPGETLDVRPLPSYENPSHYLLRLHQHTWPPFESKVRFQTVCPVQTDMSLVDLPMEPCPACAMEIETEFHGLLYCLVRDRRKVLCLKFTPQNQKVLMDLIFYADLKVGKWVRLSADERWKLSYVPLEEEPVSEKAFKMAITGDDLHASHFQVRSDKLQALADVARAWARAGRPLPRRGQAEELIRLLPGCTLVPIPWGFKGPQELAWQNTPYEMMKNPDYVARLDDGNIGLLCGRDYDAVKSGLLPNLAVVGLDADDEEFAWRLKNHNPWLKQTFKATGNKGVKWFFAMEAKHYMVLESTKIYRYDKGVGVEVGDWLASAKEGVIAGFHPAGKMYEHNGLPLLKVREEQIKFPTGYDLGSRHVELPTAEEQYTNRPKSAGPILSVDCLEEAVRGPDGSIQAACPACRQNGKDTGGDNLMIWKSGQYKCAAFIGATAEENHRHNQQIYRLAGIERQTDYE